MLDTYFVSYNSNLFLVLISSYSLLFTRNSDQVLPVFTTTTLPVAYKAEIPHSIYDI
jgi:hypothetical protein